MKDVSKTITYKNTDYTLIFNLNVMEKIQEEYGTIDKWGDYSDGTATDGEPNAKAVIFGFTAMINEGIEIENEDNGTDRPLVTPRFVGRMLSDIGFEKATTVLNETVIESTQSNEKNE